MTSQSGIDIVTCGGETTVEAGTTEIESPFEAFPSEAIRLRPPPTARAILDAACSDPAFDRLGLDPCSSVEIFAGSGCAPEEIHRRELRELCVATVIGDLDEMAVFEIAPACRDTLRLACVTRQTFNPLPPHLQGLVMDGVAAAEPTHPNSASIGTSVPGGPSMSTGTAPSAAAGLTSIGSTALSKDTRDTLLSKATSTRDTVRDGVGFDVSAPQGVVLSTPRALTGLLPCVGGSAVGEKAAGSGDRDGKPPPVPPPQPQERGPSASAVAADGGVPIIPLMSPETPHFAPVDPSLLMSPPSAAKSDRDAVLRRGGALTLEEDSDGDTPRQGASRSGGGTLSIAVPNQCLEGSVGESSPRHRNPDYGGWTPKAGAQGAGVTPTHQSSVLRRHPLGSLGSLSSSVAGKRSLPAVPSRSHTPTGADAARRRMSVGSDGSVDFAVSSAAAVGALLSPASHGPVSPQAGFVSPSARRTSETQTVLSLGASARRGSDRSRPRFNSGSFTLSQLRSDDAEPTVDVVTVPRTTAADAGDDQGFVFTDAGEGYVTIVPWSTPELAVTTAPRGGQLTLAPAVASDPRQQFAMYIVGPDAPPTTDGASSSSATDPSSDICSGNASDVGERSSSSSPSSASSSSDTSSARYDGGVEIDVETEQRLHGMTMYNATRWYQQSQQCASMTRPTGASTADPLVHPGTLRLIGCVKFVLSPRSRPDHVLVMGAGEARRGSSVSQPSAAPQAQGNELSLVAIEDASVDAAFVAVPKLTMEAAVARVRDEAEETARRDATLWVIGALDDASHFPLGFESSLTASPQNLDDSASVANEPKERREDLMLCVACEDNVSSDTAAAGSLLTFVPRSKPVQSQQQQQQFIPIDAGDGYVSFAPLCASDLLLTVDFLFAKDKKSVAPTGAQNTSVALSTSEVEDSTQESAAPIPLSCLFSAADDPIGAVDTQSEGPVVLRLQPSDIDGPRAEQQFEIVPFNQDLPRLDHGLRNKHLSRGADAGPRRCVLVPRSHPDGVVCCVASLESRLQAAIDGRSESADGSTVETAVVGRQKARDRLDMIIAEKARVERMTQIRRDVGLLAKDFVANAGIVSILRQQLRTLEAESVVTDAADFAAALRPRLQVVPRSAVTGACVLSVVERDSLETTANIGSSHVPTVTVHADDEAGIEKNVWSQLLSGGLSGARASFDQVYELVPCAAPEHRVTFYHASGAVVVENRAEDPDPQLWEEGERSVAVFHRLRERSQALEKTARANRQTRDLPTGGDRARIPEDRSVRARTLATLEPQKTSTGAVGPYHMPKVVTEEEERLLAARRLLAKMEAGRAAKLEARQRDAARDAEAGDEVDQCVGGEDVCGQSTLLHAQATEEHWEHDVEDFRCFRPSSRASYMTSSWAPCDAGSRPTEEETSILTLLHGHEKTTAERKQRQRERDQLLGEALFVGGSKMTRVHGSTSKDCSPNLSRKSSFAVSTCSDALSPAKSPSLRPLATNSEPSVRDGEGDALHRDVGVKAPAFESEAEAQAYHDGEEFLALDVSDRETLTRTQGVRILDVGGGYAAIVPCNAPHLALAMAAEHGHLRLGPVGQRGVTEAIEAHFEAVVRNDDDGEHDSDDPGQHDGQEVEKAVAAPSVCLIPRQAARPLVVEVDYDAVEPRPFFDFLAGTKTALPKAPARPPRGPGLSLVSPEEASSYCDFMLIPRACTPEK